MNDRAIQRAIDCFFATIWDRMCVCVCVCLWNILFASFFYDVHVCVCVLQMLDCPIINEKDPTNFHWLLNKDIS